MIRRNTVAPFGHALGVAHGGVIAYSSDYDSADDTQFPSRHSYISFHEGIYCGFKYQCVEFARRWMVSVLQCTFGDVGMAYEIFEIPHFKTLEHGKAVRLERDVNGGTKHRPQRGSLLMWHPGGFFRHTGHVAVITEATDAYVRVAEQNVTDIPWDEGCDYARELPVMIGEDGSYVIRDPLRGARVLGWVTPALAQQPPVVAQPQPPKPAS